MSSREFAEEMAYHQYFSPLPDSWAETALMASASWNPHVDKKSKMDPKKLVPVKDLPKEVSRTQEEHNLLVAQQITTHLLTRKKKLESMQHGSSG